MWQDVIAASAPHGLTAPHGSAPDVAVAGYALNGGLSFYGRTHGLAANAIRAVEVVTADGSLVRADADQHADLFWAVRGGGANLGVVVAIELDLLPYADVFAGMLLWDRERAPEVVPAWVQWTREVPESVTTSMRVMSFPPMPELPPFLSGRDLVVIDGAVLEDDERAAELLAPLRALAPEMDTFGRMPVTGLLDVHMDPPAPTPAVSDHSVLGELTDDAVDAFLGAGRAGHRHRTAVRRAPPARRRLRTSCARRRRAVLPDRRLRDVLHRRRAVPRRRRRRRRGRAGAWSGPWRRGRCPAGCRRSPTPARTPAACSTVRTGPAGPSSVRPSTRPASSSPTTRSDRIADPPETFGRVGVQFRAGQRASTSAEVTTTTFSPYSSSAHACSEPSSYVTSTSTCPSAP